MTNLQTLRSLLEKKSQQLNLFSAKDRELLEEKHFPDALAILDFWKLEGGMNVLDLGSGGGIPALPLAVSCPQAHFTLSDSRSKKMDAMYDIAKHELEIVNVVIISGRFEETAHLPDFREAYDITTARAVAPLPVLLEYAVGFLKTGGRLYAWKGPDYEAELAASKNAMQKLHMEFEGKHEYTLPTGEDRVILSFKKTAPTPKEFPRRDGVPKTKPL
jgi:16S rRNA (guanine527-N7)-methyltransferase